MMHDDRLPDRIREFLGDFRWEFFGTILAKIGYHVSTVRAYRYGRGRTKGVRGWEHTVDAGRRYLLRSMLYSMCEHRGGRGFAREFRLKPRVVRNREEVCRKKREAMAKLTPEQRSARVRAAWVTRRQKQLRESA